MATKLTYSPITVIATAAQLRSKYENSPAKLALTIQGAAEPIYVPLFDKPVAKKAVVLEKAIRASEAPVEVTLMHAINDEGYDEYRIVADADEIAADILGSF